VRELANVIERLVIMYPYGVVDVHDLPAKFQVESGELRDAVIAESSPITVDQLEVPRLPRDGIDLKRHLTVLECNLIKQALDDAEGVVAHAASRLRLRRTTLVEKLRKYGLQKSDVMT
jgi:sigma-54 specific flagellar transcriptional regulator A